MKVAKFESDIGRVTSNRRKQVAVRNKIAASMGSPYSAYVQDPVAAEVTALGHVLSEEEKFIEAGGKEAQDFTPVSANIPDNVQQNISILASKEQERAILVNQLERQQQTYLKLIDQFNTEYGPGSAYEVMVNLRDASRKYYRVGEDQWHDEITFRDQHPDYPQTNDDVQLQSRHKADIEASISATEREIGGTKSEIERIDREISKISYALGLGRNYAIEGAAKWGTGGTLFGLTVVAGIIIVGWWRSASRGASYLPRGGRTSAYSIFR